MPVGADALVWNSGRVYGRYRLPRLLGGWAVVGAYGYDEAADLDRDTAGGGERGFASGHEHQPVFVVEPVVEAPV